MNRPKRDYVNVDDLARSVSTEQVLQHFGLAHEMAHRVGNEIRARCFLNCGKAEPTGDRVLAIKDEDVKRWCCHRYECPHKQGGNLVGLIDLMLPGQHHAGRPRGDRFKEVLATLKKIAGTVTRAATAVAPVALQPAATHAPKINAPLADSLNEKARELVTLHEKFISDQAAMSPAAASYFRRRPYLTSEVASDWRMGYLSHDTGPGGTMRGKIVYQLCDSEGRVIGYCGRDPEFETRHARWVAGGRQDDEPIKVRFPKLFHRGIVLYGEHRLREPLVRDQVQALGTLLVVEGPNESVRMSLLQAPAVSVLSNRITSEQADKVSRWAVELGNVPVTLMFDLDPEGETGMQQALFELAQRCAVKLAWSRSMFAGQFKDRQPENLTDAEWSVIRDKVRSGAGT